METVITRDCFNIACSISFTKSHQMMKDQNLFLHEFSIWLRTRLILLSKGIYLDNTKTMREHATKTKSLDLFEINIRHFIQMNRLDSADNKTEYSI